MLWTSLEIWLFFFTKIKWWIFSSILHKWKMDFYSLNPMDYQWNLISPIPGSFWMDISEIILLPFSWTFWTQINWVPQAPLCLPEIQFLSSLYQKCFNSAKTNEKFQISWFVVLLSWQTFQRHSWVSYLLRSYLSYSFDLSVLFFIKLTPSCTFLYQTLLHSSPSPCLPLR